MSIQAAMLKLQKEQESQTSADTKEFPLPTTVSTTVELENDQSALLSFNGFVFLLYAPTTSAYVPPDWKIFAQTPSAFTVYYYNK